MTGRPELNFGSANRRSDRSGNMTDFGNPVNLSNTQNQAGKFVNQVRSVAVHNNVCVAWEDHSGGNNSQILLRTSHDGGVTFGPSIGISDAILFADRPELAAAGEFIHVIYVELHTLPGLYIRTSQTSGGTFDKPIFVGTPGPNHSTWHPSAQIAAAKNNVYVVWCGHLDADSDVFFRRSTNHGASFDLLIKLSNVAAPVFDPKIAVSGELVYVVWEQDGPGTDIFFVASDDEGKTFTKPVNLSNDTYSYRPQIAVSGNLVYVTWVSDDPLNTRDIFITVGVLGGKVFAKPTNLSKNPNDYISDFPQIAAYSNYVYVVWQTGYDPAKLGLVPSGDIFFTQNANYGASADFLAPLNISARNTKTVEAWFPKLAVRGRRVSVLWSLILQNGVTNLYYTSRTGNQVAFETPIELGKIYVYSVLANLPTTAPVYATWDSYFGVGQDDAFFIRGRP